MGACMILHHSHDNRGGERERDQPGDYSFNNEVESTHMWCEDWSKFSTHMWCEDWSKFSTHIASTMRLKAHICGVKTAQQWGWKHTFCIKPYWTSIRGLKDKLVPSAPGLWHHSLAVIKLWQPSHSSCREDWSILPHHAYDFIPQKKYWVSAYITHHPHPCSRPLQGV
jgi:hypothetical protein